METHINIDTKNKSIDIEEIHNDPQLNTEQELKIESNQDLIDFTKNIEAYKNPCVSINDNGVNWLSFRDHPAVFLEEHLDCECDIPKALEDACDEDHIHCERCGFIDRLMTDADRLIKTIKKQRGGK